jgi:hypothetical protein
MSPKERIKAAMDMNSVDKVPFMCQMSIGHMLVQLGVSPLEFWLDMDVYAEGLVKLREEYGFDGILISLYGHDLDWRDKIINIEITDEHEIGIFKNGDKLYCPFNDLPYYKFADQTESLKLELISEEKLTKELSYFPVSQNLPFFIHPKHRFDVITQLVEEQGSQYSIHGEITSPFDYYLDLFGHQEALMGLIDYPEKVKLVLEHYTKLITELADEICSTGVDAIKISSPFAGAGFISPDDYKEFVYPFEKEIVQMIRENNVHVYIHTCGAVNDRLEVMFQTGATGIECLDPPPLGNVELEEAKKRIGQKGFIKGNIDSVNLLLNGTEDEIISDISNRIEIGSKDSGFILSTACSIAPNVKKENIKLIKKIIDGMV